MNDQIQVPSNPSPLSPQRFYERDEEAINLREIFDIVWSGKWVIVIITFISLSLSVTYALVAPPIYQASGLVQIEKEKSAVGSSIDQLSALIGSAPGDAPAEIAILNSRMVLGEVAETLKLYIKVEPNYFPIFGRALVRHQKKISAPAQAPLGMSSYAWGGEKIRVTSYECPEYWYNKPLTLEAKGEGVYELKDEDKVILTGRTGERSAVETADGVAAIFVQELIARPGTTFTLTRVALQTVMDDLSSRTSIAEQPRDSGVLSLKIEHYDARFAASLVNAVEDAYLRQNVERRSAQAEQSLEFLKRQLPELKEKVDASQAKLNSYQLQKGTVDVQQETELVLKRIVELETQRLTIVQERDAALQRYTDQHPIVVTLNEQIHGLEREQSNIKKQVEALPETQQEILSLMRDLEVNTQLYTALLNSAQELQVTKAGTVGNVRIIDHALPPLEPIKPKKKIVVFFGLISGLFVGALAVFGLRSLLRGVDRPEEVEQTTGLPTYASIPYSKGQHNLIARMKRGNKESLILAELFSGDIAIEALRSLRTSLHFAMLEATNNVVMLTGPIASLGKSFVSINLGAVLAMSGKRVVVIDADLRRGQLHRYVGANQKPGLSDHVAETAEFDAIIRKSAVNGLDLIVSGSRPPNPSEILISERFSTLLNRLSKSYDYVIVDTPPVLPVTDAAIVGRLAGTTLLVLKSAEHPIRAIEESVKRLRQAGVSVRGTIFNQVGARVGSYGYGSYGYSYGYAGYDYKTKK